MLWQSHQASHVTLLGSIHGFDGQLPSWALEACNSADLIVFETDFEKAESFPRLPEGLTLSNLCSRWPEVASIAEGFKLDPEELNHLYPFSAALRIGSVAAQALLPWESGVEGVLRKRAKRAMFLETWKEFICLLFLEPPLADQLVALANLVEGLPTLSQRLLPLPGLWKCGDLESIWKILQLDNMATESPNLYAGMLTKRNELWAGRAVWLIEQTARVGHKLLIVVGCAHLANVEGCLPDYLAEHGYVFLQIP